ncbi:MAG: phosphotransferase [Armatimonas sp.]
MDLRRGLQAFYDAHGYAAPRQFVSEFVHLASGYEADVYAYTLESESSREELVLRLFRGAEASAKPQREYEAMSSLRVAEYPVPCPSTLQSSNEALGSPFLVMERVQGHSLENNFWAGDATQRAEVHALHARLMAQLHAIEAGSILPHSPLLKRQDPFASFDTELAGLYQQFQRLEVDRWPSLTECLHWVEARRESAASKQLSVIHGDFHRNNILIRDSDKEPVVIDWSNIRLADYRFDLGWSRVIALLINRLSGLPDSELISLETYAQFSGKLAEHIELFEVMGCLRILFDALFSQNRGRETGCVIGILKERNELPLGDLEE